MGRILQDRLKTNRRLHPGEEVLLALGIAAGELGTLVDEVLRSHDLTRARYNVLRILRGAGAGGATCSEIAERLLVSAPDVTRLVDPLVEQGWVRRARAPQDRRIVVQRLTSSGRALLDTVHEPLTTLYDSVAESLGPRRRAEVVRQCEAIIDLVRSEAIGADRLPSSDAVSS